MPQSYTSLHYHLIFSTKNRLPLITTTIQTRLWEYLGGIVKNASGIPVQIGGVEDHVHLLVTLRQDLALSAFLRDLKASSSGWVHDTFPDTGGFWWQTGYGAFTVSHSAIEDVKRYILNQEELTRRCPFRMSSGCSCRSTVFRSTSDICGRDVCRRSAARVRGGHRVPGVPLAKPRFTPGYRRSPLRGCTPSGSDSCSVGADSCSDTIECGIKYARRPSVNPTTSHRPRM